MSKSVLRHGVICPASSVGSEVQVYTNFVTGSMIGGV